MPRAPTGNVYASSGRLYARVTVAPKLRRSFALPQGFEEEQAAARLAVLAVLARELRKADVRADLAQGILERAASAEDEKALAMVRRAAERLCAGQLVPDRERGALTFREVANKWTSGELARAYPDHVRPLKHPGQAAGRLAHVMDTIGDVPIAEFTLEHAIEAMRSLSPDLEIWTRRVIGEAMARVLSLCVWPLRLIKASPIPRGFLPKPKGSKAKSYLYPAEDRALLGCVETPLERRVLYGFLAREGMRSSEAAALAWKELDLERGSVRLEETKTADPRAWALDPGVVHALRRWKEIRPPRSPASLVFVDEDGNPLNGKDLADDLREDLKRAGVERPELYERSKTRLRLRAHDLRATFVTLSLANGRTEAWVMDRTAHKTSRMVSLYRRAARQAEELGLGPLAALDEAIPELRPPAGARGPGEGRGGRGAGRQGKGRPKRRADDDPAPNEGPAEVVAQQTIGHEPARGAANPGDPVAPPAGSRRLATGRASSIARSAHSPERAREQALERLGAELAALAAAGDIEGARVLHEALGRLLACSSAAAPREQGGRIPRLGALLGGAAQRRA